MSGRAGPEAAGAPRPLGTGNEGAGETRETKRCASRSSPGGAPRGRGPRAGRGRVWPRPSTAVRQDPTPPLEQTGPHCKIRAASAEEKHQNALSPRRFRQQSAPGEVESPAPLMTEAGGAHGCARADPVTQGSPSHPLPQLGLLDAQVHWAPGTPGTKLVYVPDTGAPGNQ